MEIRYGIEYTRKKLQRISGRVTFPGHINWYIQCRCFWLSGSDIDKNPVLLSDYYYNAVMIYKLATPINLNKSSKIKCTVWCAHEFFMNPKSHFIESIKFQFIRWHSIVTHLEYILCLSKAFLVKSKRHLTYSTKKSEMRWKDTIDTWTIRAQQLNIVYGNEEISQRPTHLDWKFGHVTTISFARSK